METFHFGLTGHIRPNPQLVWIGLVPLKSMTLQKPWLPYIDTTKESGNVLGCLKLFASGDWSTTFPYNSPPGGKQWVYTFHPGPEGTGSERSGLGVSTCSSDCLNHLQRVPQCLLLKLLFGISQIFYQSQLQIIKL